MTRITEEQIRDRAHLIWEREGRPEGRGQEHWDMAAAELASEASETAPAEAPAAADEPEATEAAGAPKKRAARAPKAEGEAAPKRAPAKPRAKKDSPGPSA